MSSSSPSSNCGQDSRALTNDFRRLGLTGPEMEELVSDTSGTRMTWKEYELYSLGICTLILFRRGFAIVSIGDMACSFLCLPSESNYTINWRVLIGNAIMFCLSLNPVNPVNPVRTRCGKRWAEVSVPRRSVCPQTRCLSPTDEVPVPRRNKSDYTPGLEQAKNAHCRNERIVKAEKNEHAWRLAKPIASPAGLSKD